MSGRIGNCIFKTGYNEQIDAVVKLPKETRSCIFGTVLDENGLPVADAVVKLLQVNDKCDYPIPLTHTFTDDNDIGRMTWHQEPKKDVTSCEKLRLGANIHRPADIRMGKPGTAIPYHCMVNT